MPHALKVIIGYLSFFYCVFAAYQHYTQPEEVVVARETTSRIITVNPDGTERTAWTRRN